MKINIEFPTFWFVWTKTGRVPRKAHNSLESARTEALRLAELNPNKKFIILESKEKIHVSDD